MILEHGSVERQKYGLDFRDKSDFCLTVKRCLEGWIDYLLLVKFYVYGYIACMHACALCVLCLKRLQEDIRVLELELQTMSYYICCWEWNSFLE